MQSLALILLSITENSELQVSQKNTNIPFPESFVIPDSAFYIERNNLENFCYETIIKPGSLIRIKASKLMGKTSLIKRIIADVTRKNYRTIYLDLSSYKNLNLEQFLQESSTEAGVYSNHLRGYLEVLKKYQQLAQAFKIIINSPEPVELDLIQIYKLHSMGLIKILHNCVIPSCNLYREYFQIVLD